MSRKRRFVECEPELAEEIRLFCFLRQVTMKKFVTKTLDEAMEPYRAWLQEVKGASERVVSTPAFRRKI